jgi:hypothetical protein
MAVLYLLAGDFTGAAAIVKTALAVFNEPPQSLGASRTSCAPSGPRASLGFRLGLLGLFQKAHDNALGAANISHRLREERRLVARLVLPRGHVLRQALECGLELAADSSDASAGTLTLGSGMGSPIASAIPTRLATIRDPPVAREGFLPTLPLVLCAQVNHHSPPRLNSTMLQGDTASSPRPAVADARSVDALGRNLATAASTGHSSSRPQVVLVLCPSGEAVAADIVSTLSHHIQLEARAAVYSGGGDGGVEPQVAAGATFPAADHSSYFHPQEGSQSTAAAALLMLRVAAGGWQRACVTVKVPSAAMRSSDLAAPRGGFRALQAAIAVSGVRDAVRGGGGTDANNASDTQDVNAVEVKRLSTVAAASSSNGATSVSAKTPQIQEVATLKQLIHAACSHVRAASATVGDLWCDSSATLILDCSACGAALPSIASLYSSLNDSASKRNESLDVPSWAGSIVVVASPPPCGVLSHPASAAALLAAVASPTQRPCAVFTTCVDGRGATDGHRATVGPARGGTELHANGGVAVAAVVARSRHASDQVRPLAV